MTKNSGPLTKRLIIISVVVIVFSPFVLLLILLAYLNGLWTQVLAVESDSSHQALFIQDSSLRGTGTELFVYHNSVATSLGYIGSFDAGLYDTQAYWSQDGNVLFVTRDTRDITLEQMRDGEEMEILLRKSPPPLLAYDFIKQRVIYEDSQITELRLLHDGRGKTIFNGQDDFDNRARPQMLWENRPDS